MLASIARFVDSTARSLQRREGEAEPAQLAKWFITSARFVVPEFLGVLG